MGLFVRDRGFYKRVAAVAVPIAAQSLITIGINMMDTIMLGSMGETQLSASALANQFINVFHIFCMGIGMGANVLTSRYWGMRNQEYLRKTITIMLRICLCFSLAFMLATWLIPEGIMRIYTNDAQIIRQGVRYLDWSILSYFLLGFSLTCTIVLRSVGLMKIPLICSCFAFFVNVGANYIFIYGKFGAPRMEIAGAALGTLIARAFEFAFICGYFFIADRHIGYRLRHFFTKCGDLVGEYIRVSLPVLISDGLMALGNNAVAMVMGRIGANFVSANAITTVTQQLSTVLIQGVSNASAIITGHTLGQGDRRRAQAEGYSFFGIGIVLGLAACIVILALSGPIISCYDITAQTRQIAYELMASIAIIVVFTAINSILTKGVLRGGGDTKFLMAADVLFLWVASVPLGYLAGLVWRLPPFWIYFFLKIDQFLKTIWCVFRLRSGKWIKRVRGQEAFTSGAPADTDETVRA